MQAKFYIFLFYLPRNSLCKSTKQDIDIFETYHDTLKN